MPYLFERDTITYRKAYRAVNRHTKSELEFTGDARGDTGTPSFCRGRVTV